MGDTDINTLTMEQYLALTRGNQASGVVKPEIGGNVNFEIKSQFMRELREDTFSGNKNGDAYEHVERILDTVSLFNISRVTHDAFMLRVFPITLTGATKRWVERLSPRTILGFAHKSLHSKKRLKALRKSSMESLDDPFPNNNRNGAKYRVGPPGYYTRVDNRPPFGEKNPSLEELMNKHLEESSRRRAEMEEWMKKLQESTNLNTRNQNASLKNLETQIEQLANDYQAKAANKVSKETEEVPRGETNMLVEMADMTKKAHVGILENVLVKIDKFVFPSDFMVIDMLGEKRITKLVEPKTTALRMHYCKRLKALRNGQEGTLNGVPKIINTRIMEALPFHTLEIENQIKPQPRDYSFKEWLKLNIRHTNVNKFVKNAVLNEWILDCFKEESETSKDLYSRSLEDHKLVFDIEIEQLADKYELGIGKIGYVLDDIWEKCEKVHGVTTYPWHDEGFEEEERWESGLDVKYYNPPQLCAKTFEVATAKKLMIEITSACS
nr:DNA-binding pseudobarrel domain-containing protein [Tanacetum cinerariifolium]